jgi:hypothetical protein
MIYDLRKPDLNKLAVGDGIITSKGCLWEMIKIDCFKDTKSDLTWLPEEPGTFTHYKAEELQNESKRLPTKEEFEQAEKHGIREIFDMKGKYFWSASVFPSYELYAFGFFGGSGVIFVDFRYGSYGSVRCVAGR